MLEKITNTITDVVRTVSGKATISEKNIDEYVEKIKIALLDADVNLRVVRRFVNINNLLAGTVKAVIISHGASSHRAGITTVNNLISFIPISFSNSTSLGCQALTWINGFEETL